jgi:hypothetical protein
MRNAGRISAWRAYSPPAFENLHKAQKATECGAVESRRRPS